MEIINLIILLGLVGLVLFLFLKKSKPEDTGVQQQMLMLSQRMDSLIRDMNDGMNTVRKDVQDNLVNTSKGLNDRFDNAARVVGLVQNQLGQIQEANKRIYDVGKDIASLQEILRAPKLRGTIGELFLGDLLGQILPPDRFQLQYGFKSGEKVDAVIFLKDNIMVPIDSKFPLENFQRILTLENEDEKKSVKKEFYRDVKKHIDAISKKYILADEGTLDFALMYVPAENVYYETIIKDEEGMGLSSYAMEKRVIPVSPNNFYVYIQTILMGLKGMQIEKNVKEILVNLSRLSVDFEKFKEDYMLVGKHLSNARSKFDESEKRLGNFENKLSNASQVEKKLEQAVEDIQATLLE